MMLLAATALIVALLMPRWSDTARVAISPSSAWHSANFGGFVRGGSGLVVREPNLARIAPLVIYDTDTGETAQRLGDVSVDFQPTVSPDGSLCAAVGPDKRMRLWDANKGREMAFPDAPLLDSHPWSVEFRPDGSGLLVATRTQLDVFNRDGRRTGSMRFTGPGGGPWGPAAPRYVSGGTLILAESWDRSTPKIASFVLLNPTTLKEVARFGAGQLIVRTTVSHDGKRLVAVRSAELDSYLGQVTTNQIWDLDKLAAPILEFKDEVISDLDLSPDKSKLYIRGEVRRSSMLDLDKGGQRIWKGEQFAHAQSIFLPSGSAILLYHDELKQLQFCDPKTSDVSYFLPCGFGVFTLSSDGNSLAIVETPESLWIWKYGKWRWLKIVLSTLSAGLVLLSVVVWTRSRPKTVLSPSPTESQARPSPVDESSART